MTLPNAAVAKRQVPPDSEAKEKIGDVQKKLIEVGTDIRQLSHELHPPVLQESGLPEALSAYCQEFSKIHGIPVSCEADTTCANCLPALRCASTASPRKRSAM